MADSSRSFRVARILERIACDARFALRLMLRRPRFYAALLAILVGGIGATTAMFSIVRSLLLEPLPFPNPDRLTAIFAERPSTPRLKVSLPDFFDWKAKSKSFEHMATVRTWLFSLSSAGEPPEGVMGVHVSGEFFRTYGIEALHGRLLDEKDDRVGGPRVAVLSHALWRDRFKSDPALVGRTVKLNSEPYTVVGIAPEGFLYGFASTMTVHVWAPFAATYPGYESSIRVIRDQHEAYAIGRLKPGVAIEQAEAELSKIARTVAAHHPGRDVGVRLVDMHEVIVGGARTSIFVLLAAVIMIFLVVCSNAANLLLNSVQARRGELAARAALGATPSRLAQQIITETTVLFLLAAPAGALAARWLVGIFVLITNTEAIGIDVRLDATMFAFCVLLSALSALAVAILPAIAVARIDLQSVLKEHASAASLGKSQRTASGALVVTQVAVAFALLAASGVALKTFLTLSRTSFGFNPKNLATAVFLAFPDTYEDRDKLAAFQAAVLAKVAGQPGVESVAMNSATPLMSGELPSYFEIEGRALEASDKRLLVRNAVTPGYFRTMGIPLLRGRDFTDADLRATRPVIIISQNVGDRFFPERDPLGHRILHYGDDPPVFREIVGVVADIRRHSPLTPPAFESYVPATQAPFRSMTIVARSSHAGALLRDLPRLVTSVDREVPIAQPKLMGARVQESMRVHWMTAASLGAFAISALLLATVGIYGLVAYSTARRTRELGIRMALGAPAEVILALVTRSGLRLLGLGLAAGLVAAIGVARLVAVVVPGAGDLDPATCLVVASALGGAGLLACLVPAWRAVRVSPANALRYE